MTGSARQPAAFDTRQIYAQVGQLRSLTMLHSLSGSRRSVPRANLDKFRNGIHVSCSTKSCRWNPQF